MGLKIGHAFDLCAPRSYTGLTAERKFNESTLRGKSDEDALRLLVADHVASYPYGIDPLHPRTNGFDHKAAYERAAE